MKDIAEKFFQDLSKDLTEFKNVGAKNEQAAYDKYQQWVGYQQCTIDIANFLVKKKEFFVNDIVKAEESIKAAVPREPALTKIKPRKETVDGRKKKKDK